MGLARVRALGVFGILLFVSDTSSDTYVGVDLINRCHNGYAASVFSFVAMPGLLLGVACGLLCFFSARDIKVSFEIMKGFDKDCNICSQFENLILDR